MTQTALVLDIVTSLAVLAALIVGVVVVSVRRLRSGLTYLMKQREFTTNRLE